MCYLCNDRVANHARDGLGRRAFLAAGAGAAAAGFVLASNGAVAQDAASGGSAAAGEVASDRVTTKGFAVMEAKGKFQPIEFTRRPVGDDDILIDILYAGICHSDVHKVRDDWQAETYPIVPGHEIAGRVVQVGANVTKFAVGDYAGVGVWIGSCGECDYCRSFMEHKCAQKVISFGDTEPAHNNEPTNGGYSSNYVVSQNFAIKIPANAQIERVAPLMCAGITTYSPIMFSNVQRGDKVGVAGFGGLGHMAVKFAVALGAEVTVFDITEDKRQDAMRLGAERYVNVNTPSDLEGLDNSLNLVVNTIPAGHDPMMYLKMLQIGGEMAILGLPPTAEIPTIPTSALPGTSLVKIYGSDTGSISQIQAMLDYAVELGIYPDVQIIPVSEIDTAYQGILDGEVKFRYVIDMKTMA